MNSIKRKIRSQRGASITFALLLFLVCAVLCSVIITAASTASGRMANLAETDRRYYTVTSAAGLLQNLIDGQTVSVVKVEKEGFTNKYRDGVLDPSGTTETGKSTELYMVNGKATPGTELHAEELIGDPASFTSIPADAAYKVYNATEGVPSGRTLNLQSDFFGDAGAAYDAYAAVAVEEFDADGGMTLSVYNRYDGKGAESAPGSQYALKLSFELGKTEDTSTQSVEKNNNDSYSEDGAVIYTTNTTTTTTTICTYTWKLTDIKTGSTTGEEGTLSGG